MNNLPLLNDLRVFMLVARRAGFAAAAEELGVSPAFVSKRVSLLEQTLNVMLLHRTTRRVTITEEGERIYEWAQRILQDVDEMMDELSDVRQVPQGTLRFISRPGITRFDPFVHTDQFFLQAAGNPLCYIFTVSRS